jgi:hypothetical protein
MKYLFLIVLLFTASCELVKIGSGSSGIINPTQENAIGAIYLFKAELDSGNLIGASELLIQKDGKHLNAKERHAAFPLLERVAYAMKNKDIVYHTIDTLHSQAYSIRCSFNYLNTLTFSLLKSDKSWFISEIKE